MASWHHVHVQPSSFIPRLLAILAIAGLLTAPMATPSRAAAADDMSMATTSEMAAMPCCPDEKPAVPDCSKDCPLAVLCLAKCCPGVAPAAAGVLARIALVEVKTPRDDIWQELFPDPPPPKPPRT